MLSQQRIVSFVIVVIALIVLAGGALLVGGGGGRGGNGNVPTPSQPTPTVIFVSPAEGSSVQLGTFLPSTPTPTPA